MNKTWKPTVAGILTIIAGAVELVVVPILGRELIMMFPEEVAGLAGMLLFFLAPLGLLIIFLGMIAIAGGICALKRRVWGLALAGAICALPVVVIGIPGIIFLVMGKREFESRAKPIVGTGVCPKCGAPTTPQTEICSSCSTPVAEAIRRKTWKPIVAGILTIVGGAPQVVYGVLWGIPVVKELASDSPGLYILVLPWVLLMALAGIIPIVGGIYALRRKRWGLGLAGCICALPGWVVLALLGPGDFTYTLPAGVILGVLAIIFVVKGKGEFK